MHISLVPICREWNVLAGIVNLTFDSQVSVMVIAFRRFEGMRFAAFHDPLPPSDRLMGILCPIVQPFVGAALNAGYNIKLGCII